MRKYVNSLAVLMVFAISQSSSASDSVDIKFEDIETNQIATTGRYDAFDYTVFETKFNGKVVDCGLSMPKSLFNIDIAFGRVIPAFDGILKISNTPFYSISAPYFKDTGDISLTFNSKKIPIELKEFTKYPIEKHNWYYTGNDVEDILINIGALKVAVNGIESDAHFSIPKNIYYKFKECSRKINHK